MSGSTYPAAHAAAPGIEEHFRIAAARHLDRTGVGGGPTPGAAIIEEMISAGFWASLSREEGRSPRVSMVFLAPDAAFDPLGFQQPLRFSPSVLTKLAPAVERPSIHLGIREIAGHLRIWGTTTAIPPASFVVEVVEPGVIVVKRRRGPYGSKFANVAVFQGESFHFVDDQAAGDFEVGSIAASLLGSDSPWSWTDPGNVAVQLAISMRDHGHGGTLLVVPSASERWKESLVEPVTYPISPVFPTLGKLARETPDPEDRAEHREAMRRVVAGIGGLTAVDGATIINDRYELLAFGAKITRREGTSGVQKVRISAPIRGSTPTIVGPGELGGTRHFSAAQFAQDQPDALALVASQDGKFTVFLGGGDDAVRAYRIDSLLL